VTGLVPWLAGSHVVFGPANGYRDRSVIANFWAIVEAWRINVFSGVPTIFSALLQVPTDGRDLRSLDFAVCGAAPMPVELFRRFEEATGIRILEGYGLTESACVASLNPVDGERRIGSIGRPLPGQRMKSVIVDESGRYLRDAAIDEAGVVVLSGPNIFKGYKDERHDAGLWIDCGPGGPWMNTGDLGRQDAQGYFWLTGRKKQLIIRGGHNIDPATIEEPLHRHPDVALAAAVGRPDAHAGEVPVAYVQLRAGSSVSEGELAAFAADAIGERAAVPKAVRIVAQMPVTAVGKIYKPALVVREIEDVVRQEAAAAGAALIAVDIKADARCGMVAEVRVAGRSPALRAALARYAFAVETTEA
jgi:fatty-acyl-CoA synthase